MSRSRQPSTLSITLTPKQKIQLRRAITSAHKQGLSCSAAATQTQKGRSWWNRTFFDQVWAQLEAVKEEKEAKQRAASTPPGSRPRSPWAHDDVGIGA